MQPYQFTAPAASGSVPIAAVGSYVRYLSVSAGVYNPMIRIKTDAGDELVLLPGQGARVARPVGRWSVTNYDGVADITGILMIGDGQFEDDRITGEVSIIDGGKARTLSGSAFLLNANAGGVGGQYSHGQLWNPAASGVRVVLEALSFSSSTAQNIGVGRSIAALASASGAAMNKSLGGAVGQALGRSENNAVQQYVTPNYLLNYSIQAGLVQTINLREPIVLDEGHGIVIVCGTMATNLGANFEYFEEGI